MSLRYRLTLTTARDVSDVSLDTGQRRKCVCFIAGHWLLPEMCLKYRMLRKRAVLPSAGEIGIITRSNFLGTLDRAEHFPQMD
jgi:hypothetical protein